MTTYPIVDVVGVTWPLKILGNKWQYLENGARYRHSDRMARIPMTLCEFEGHFCCYESRNPSAIAGLLVTEDSVIDMLWCCAWWKIKPTVEWLYGDPVGLPHSSCRSFVLHRSCLSSNCLTDIFLHLHSSLDFSLQSADVPFRRRSNGETIRHFEIRFGVHTGTGNVYRIIHGEQGNREHQISPTVLPVVNQFHHTPISCRICLASTMCKYDVIRKTGNT